MAYVRIYFATRMERLMKSINNMEKTNECDHATLPCVPLIRLIDESGERYLYDWNLSQSLPANKNFRVGECLQLGDLDCRCLYRRLHDGAYKRMNDGLVMTFPYEDSDREGLLHNVADDELSDAAYCARYGIVGGNYHGEHTFTLEENA